MSFNRPKEVRNAVRRHKNLVNNKKKWKKHLDKEQELIKQFLEIK